MTRADTEAIPDSPSRLVLHALDPQRRVDYALAFAVGGLPIVVAYFIGAHCLGAPCHVQQQTGYWQSPNWWSLAVALPVLLYVFRLIMARVAPVGSPWPPSIHPPIVNLVRGDTARRAVYEDLRRRVLSRRNAAVSLVITVVVHLLDAPTVLAPYLGRDIQVDQSWMYLFLVDEQVSMEMNLLLLLSAGLAQFCVVFLAVLSIMLMLRHNLFFLGNVYQRRWVPAGQEARFFQINPRDVNRCFGFRVANIAFNAQVLALMIAGAAMFLSRSAHSPDRDSLVAELLTGSLKISLPLPSQWFMALSWLAALAVVAMPALVKLLPRLPGRGTERTELSVGNYLREFFSDDAWPEDKSGRKQSIQQVAARFAQNAFWPTGDNRAGVLFFFAYLIFFVTLLPPPLGRPIVVLADLSLFAVLAYLVQRLTFLALEHSLRYVDELLVGKSAAGEQWEGVRDDVDARRDVGVFISYRRSDSAPYARSLHERLLDQFSEERIFMDIADIEAGENFVQRIDRALDTVDAVIAVIGEKWMTMVDDDSRPRIADSNDMVHIELATALRRGKRVFPVTVGGARMPAASELPEALRALSELNALEISDARWSYDVGRLIEALRRV